MGFTHGYERVTPLGLAFYSIAFIILGVKYIISCSSLLPILHYGVKCDQAILMECLYEVHISNAD